MKSRFGLGLIVLIAGMRLAVAATPPPPAGGGTGDPAVAGNPMEHHARFMEGRLEALHSALKLKPEQEAAWRQWSDSIKASRPDWKEKHPDAEGLAKLPAPDRLEKMVAFAKERLARLEERLAATRTFYEVLSPEQRATFDKEFNFWPHGGRGGKPHPGGPPPGPRDHNR